MLQIFQSYRSGVMRLDEVPIPVCQETGILVRVASSLVSAGTEKMLVDLAKKSLAGKALARPDLVRQVVKKMRKEGAVATLQKVFSKLDNPIPLGYSCAGKVIAVGSRVQRFQVGDWVACGGAGYANHAQINYVPQNLAVKLPEGLDPDIASFATVGAIALQGVRQAQVELGHRVGVLGLGLLGQLTVQILKASGAKVLCMDISPAKMEMARRLGADGSATAEDFVAAAKNMSDGFGLDAVIITASTPSNAPIELAGEACRQKGKVVVVGMVGMDIPRNEYYKKELDLRLSMSYGPGRYDPSYEEKGIDYPYTLVRWTEGRNIQTFVELCAEGRIDPKQLVTHRFPFNEALKAYELFEGKTREPYLGILLQYDLSGAVRESLEIPARVRKKNLTAQAPRVGLVGAGNFAKGVLLPILQATRDVELVSLATATGVSARATAEKLGLTKVFSDFTPLVQDPAINTVIITTRHDLHARAVLTALESGKHVFVEKPLCIHEAELIRIEKTYAELEIQPVLLVGFNRRFSSHAQALRKWIDNSTERPFIRYRINAGQIPNTHWIQDSEVGGGRIIGEGCHFVDLCAYLAGSEIVEAYATALDSPGGYSQDNVAILLKHADGSRSAIDYLANGDPALPKELIEVFCGKGIARCEDFKVTEWSRSGKTGKHRTGVMDKGFEAELKSFIQAVQGASPSPIAFESLANTTRTTFRIMESLTSNRVMRI